MSACKIVIVGGGAGGLELATKLGRYYRNKDDASVLLLDKHAFHIWKPLLHEVASGSMNAETEGLDYRQHAANNGFEFQMGCLNDIDRDNKQLKLDAINDVSGEVLVPERTISYNICVLALGSVTNDFGVPGVKQHSYSLDDTQQAARFHKRVFNQFIRLKALGADKPLRIAVVGAGATGVELTAELYQLAESLKMYGFKNVDRSSLQVQLIEAGPRVLAALPERISDRASEILKKLGTELHLSTRVNEICENGLKINDGEFLEADLLVWCAGVKCRDFLKDIGGLETNRANQVVVNDFLQSSIDSDIFALGDCAALTQADGSQVPPRAQSAHQMASQVYKNIKLRLSDRPEQKFEYKDHGSLVSFANYSSVGVLRGLVRERVFVEGSIAKRLYVSLYRLHQVALHGYFRTGLLMLVSKLSKKLRPVLKLH
ncbi:NAD(P)/FAD-dependent oxidoreductase [Agaribacterium sp. ZY112]|uniref:NAD(P)/FAD-dependent oxidoreductase n=1 Tax=Agaribacterium sp. ZY112 TaxID=3233574 RepID=UPI003525D4EC